MTQAVTPNQETKAANPPRIGFAISTMERMDFTSQVLPGLDCGGFDLIWCDGSKSAEGKAFANAGHFKKTPLREVHHDVRGGPDAAIQFSLKRLLNLGYDYVGLIENDIQLKPGWLEALMAAWQAAEKDGFKVGSVTARSMASRVLARGPHYVVKWNMGAGMVLFSRAAAEAVLADYRLGTAKEIQGNFFSSTGVDISPAWELFMEQADRPLGADWRYASALWKNGMISIGTIPTMAENIDVDIRDFCRTDYVRSAQQELSDYCLTIEQLKTALVCCAPCSKIPVPSFGGASVWLEKGGNNLVSGCPACQTSSPVVVVKKTHNYHRCPACECVFTPKIDLGVLETENHGHSLRHDQGQDAERLQRLVRALGVRPGKLIDFGCGKGETTRYLQAQGLDVVGIDQDTPVQLKDIPDESVDGIMMVEVIEHLYEPRDIFRHFNRVLRMGGVAYVESSFADNKNLRTWEYLDPAIGHCTVHTLRSVAHMAEEYGFAVKWLNGNVFTFTKQVSLKGAASIEIIGTGIAEPLVTAVIATYRSENRLRAALENLSRQTIFGRCEILVIDNGSPENERGVVAEFQQKHANVRYIRVPQTTTFGAWNHGLRLARGRYWANVNVSDTLRDDALEILFQALERNTECAFAYADTSWTNQANDCFSSQNVIKTVRYSSYAPIEVLFYNVTGCLQFFRTDSLRQLGGYDASLYFAGDYDVVLKAMLAQMNAVHVPEVLTLFHQGATSLVVEEGRGKQEQRFIQNRSRGQLGIGHIFQVEPGNLPAAANGLAMLGVRALKHNIPWQEKPAEDVEFSVACFEAALGLDPENLAAGTNLIALHYKLKKLKESEAELIARWPKMREWLRWFHMGEGAHQTLEKHAVVGPVYRPDEWANRPTAEQLAKEPEALRPWICRISGRHVYLSRDVFPIPAGPRYTSKELQEAGRRLAWLLTCLPPFYAHFGGAGDLLLLMASFYDQAPKSVIFSHPNSVPATQALLEGFPELSKVYFLPQHTEPFFHIILRYAVYELKNCLGAGTTPKDDYDVEWKAGLDIVKKYGIQKTPRWAAALRQNKDSKQVAVAPKGSLSGMVGTKRNIIDPEIWPAVIAHIQERGFEPVIFGVPSEAKEYPALPGCVEARTKSFVGQMQHIGQCAGLVGADSWAKSFTALAEIPTVVFEPLKGADIASWKDASDWVFIEPWPSIKMVRSLEDFRRAFDARIAKVPGTTIGNNTKPVIAWEGSFLDHGSLSYINRELTARLNADLAVSRVGAAVPASSATQDNEIALCAKQLQTKAPANTVVTVRHQWPPNWKKPASGKLVVIQPWEYGALPKDWIAAAANVDEFWVPSPIVRHMYVDSGIAPEKVRVVPNGVDTSKYRPGVKPLALKTKKKFKFLFVGGTIFRKGPDILLDAFVQAFSANDDVCLVVKDFGGDSCYQGQTAEAAIHKLQQTPGAPEIIYLNQELSGDQMPSLYAACDCLVLPYRGEGFGLPVLEAMACGLPVIVTGGGATESFVPLDAGWRIPSQYQLLADRVGSIQLVKQGWLLAPSKTHLVAIFKIAASNPAECRRRGAIGRDMAAKRYDWNDVAAAVSHRLKEMAEQSPISAAASLPEVVPVTTEPKAEVKPVAVKTPEAALVGRLNEARELFGSKQLESAWQAAVTAIAHRPFHPEAFLLLAEIALAAGDGAIARKCAQYARDLAPGFTAAKQFLKQSLKTGAVPAWLKLPEQMQKTSSAAGKLSVCLIVKNEEKFLGQCLKSVRDIASQIVVVDTGSTDRTVEIAREFGAEIFSTHWSDDFAAARNAALQQATGDWVLMLDADEELPAAEHDKLKADMKNAAVMGYRLPLVNVGMEAEGHSYVPRLFRNAPGVHFVGRIHEQVFGSLLPLCQAWGIRTALGKAELLHHGYSKQTVLDRNKVERNLKLLKLAVDENPGDVNLVMNLGLELVRSEDLHGGIAHYRKAFEMMSAQKPAQVAPELREVLLTQFTCQLYKIRAHGEVVETLNSPLAKNGGLTASLHLTLGLSYFELRDYRLSAEQMRQCLAKRNQAALSPINVDIHSAAPQHCLALCLVQLNDKSGAEKAFQTAVTAAGSVEAAKLDYAKFLAGENRPLEALQKLNEVVAKNPQQTLAWKAGGEIALSRAEFLDFACDWTGEAVRALPENVVLLEQRAEALTLAGKAAEAAKAWQQLDARQPDDRQQAALILCELAANTAMHGLEGEADEIAVSRRFIEWYQKLISMRSQTMLTGINGRLGKLSMVLPTAAQMLEAALAESRECIPA